MRNLAHLTTSELRYYRRIVERTIETNGSDVSYVAQQVSVLLKIIQEINSRNCACANTKRKIDIDKTK